MKIERFTWENGVRVVDEARSFNLAVSGFYEIARRSGAAWGRATHSYGPGVRGRCVSYTTTDAVFAIHPDDAKKLQIKSTRVRRQLNAVMRPWEQREAADTVVQELENHLSVLDDFFLELFGRTVFEHAYDRPTPNNPNVTIRMSLDECNKLVARLSNNPWSRSAK